MLPYHQWIVLLLSISLTIACQSSHQKAPNSASKETVYESEELSIKTIAKSTYLHTSYLNSKQFSKVPCNGLIYQVGDSVLVIDTPIDDVASNQLIAWIRKSQKAAIKAVIPTHFHVDCLGGLAAFHEEGIPSFAHTKTIALATDDNVQIPQHSLIDSSIFNLGTEHVLLQFFGEGHTKDNIIAYLPEEQVLFGGCLIKSLGSGKGNLKDANVDEWANTVQRVKQGFPNVEVVIPGHGSPGNSELLDYTISKFSK